MTPIHSRVGYCFAGSIFWLYQKNPFLGKKIAAMLAFFRARGKQNQEKKVNKCFKSNKRSVFPEIPPPGQKKQKTRVCPEFFPFLIGLFGLLPSCRQLPKDPHLPTSPRSASSEARKCFPHGETVWITDVSFFRGPQLKERLIFQEYKPHFKKFRKKFEGIQKIDGKNEFASQANSWQFSTNHLSFCRSSFKNPDKYITTPCLRPKVTPWHLNKMEAQFPSRIVFSLDDPGDPTIPNLCFSPLRCLALCVLNFGDLFFGG